MAFNNIYLSSNNLSKEEKVAYLTGHLFDRYDSFKEIGYEKSYHIINDLMDGGYISILTVSDEDPVKEFVDRIDL